MIKAMNMITANLPSNGLLAVGCLLLTLAFSCPAHGETTRADFAKAMGTLSPGMSAEQVVAILGKPDDVRTPYDPGGISAARTTEIWAYGTDARLRLYGEGQGPIYIRWKRD